MNKRKRLKTLFCFPIFSLLVLLYPSPLKNPFQLYNFEDILIFFFFFISLLVKSKGIEITKSVSNVGDVDLHPSLQVTVFLWKETQLNRHLGLSSNRIPVWMIQEPVM